MDQEPRIEQVGPDQLHLSFWVITEVQEERFIILYKMAIPLTQVTTMDCGRGNYSPGLSGLRMPAGGQRCTSHRTKIPPLDCGLEASNANGPGSPPGRWTNSGHLQPQDVGAT